MSTRLVVDAGRCAGIGLCESTAPDYFVLDDDNVSTVLRPTVGEDDVARVDEAIVNCPMQAIARREA